MFEFMKSNSKRRNIYNGSDQIFWSNGHTSTKFNKDVMGINNRHIFIYSLQGDGVLYIWLSYW